MFREPPYKRKRGNGSRGGGPYGNRGWHNNQGQQQKHKHWDEPGTSESGTLQHEVVAPPPTKKEKPKRYQIDHELTQEELWDDSALIAAWDAAVEEYHSLNGPEKNWKEEPVHKSALWYAPAPKPQEDENEDDEEEEGEIEAEEEDEAIKMEQEVEPDSAPLDFNTFIPSHDPTLGGGGGATTQSAIGPQPPTTAPAAFPDVSTLTRDEIFEKAMSASYWAGYWTAMYHASGTTSSAQNEADEEEVEADEMVHVEDTADPVQQVEP